MLTAHQNLLLDKILLFTVFKLFSEVNFKLPKYLIFFTLSFSRYFFDSWLDGIQRSKVWKILSAVFDIKFHLKKDFLVIYQLLKS